MIDLALRHAVDSCMERDELFFSAFAEADYDSDLPIMCAICSTPLVEHDAGWQHEVGFAERDGCMTPWPD